MAEPTCPKCGKHEFEFRDILPDEEAKSHFYAVIIYCTNCGTIIGTGGNYFVYR